MNSEAVFDAASAFLERASERPKSRELPELARMLSNEDVIWEVMGCGLSSGRSEERPARLASLQRLARWHERQSEYVAEYEIRAYLVWPLLQVLGWSEQCVKFEYRYRDLVVFEEPLMYEQPAPRCRLIGETEAMFSGLTGAQGQAWHYAEEDDCGMVMITDGVRYLVEWKADGAKESAYLNLLRLLDRHPYDEPIAGAPKVLSKLLKG